ncbi:MAG: hypothetical protein IH605_15390 [Burkholderiales bacterium]|nr:hypothetical protein [Burkholderiales bacterium]
MKLNHDLPKPVTWIARIIGYGIGSVVFLGVLAWFGLVRMATFSEECLQRPGVFKAGDGAIKTAQSIDECLQAQNSFLENLLRRSTHKTLKSLPNAPCKYVGVWNSPRLQGIYQYSLHEDSKFTVAPLDRRNGGDFYSGEWGVYRGKMVWLYDEGRVWPPDVNVIKSTDGNSFSLVEADNSITTFTRVGALESISCPQNGPIVAK